MWLQRDTCQIPNKRDTPEKKNINNNHNNNDERINKLKKKIDIRNELIK